MRGFGYLLKEGFKNVWSNRIMSIASVCVLISCLILTGAAELLSLNVEKVVDSVGQSNETTVYLKDSVSELEAVYIGKDIEKIDNITSVRFYSKDDAFEPIVKISAMNCLTESPRKTIRFRIHI